MKGKKKKITKEISIKELQDTLKNKELELRIQFSTLTKKEKDVLMKTVKLQEEVGELANEILAVLSLQRKSKLDAFTKKNMYEEFGDVLLSTMSLANALKVDLNRAAQEKLDKIIKVYSKDK